jgi:hypothetical protein
MKGEAAPPRVNRRFVTIKPFIKQLPQAVSTHLPI